jgi:hypothetical protein
MIRTYYPEPDTLKFYYKVSSEPNYDYLQFKLNDTEILKKSGETIWYKQAVEIPAGFNKMEWIYRKDNSVSQGADGAWIDLIDFSGLTVVKYIQKDLEVAEIVSPVQKEVYGKELVSVKVRNAGSDTLSGFDLAYSVNGKMPVIQYFGIELVPYKDSAIVTFDKRANMDLSGIYDILVFGHENNDDFLSNDTIMIKIENTEIEESVNIFPDPFIENLNLIINSKVSRNVSISLTNVSGKKVHIENIELTEGENDIVINTSQLSPALYILNINGPGISRAFPLIKIKQ